MSKITFGYIVGGEDKHYNNLLRSLESLERIEQPHEVVILDADSRLEACLLYTSPSPRDFG